MTNVNPKSKEEAEAAAKKMDARDWAVFGSHMRAATGGK